MNVKPGTPVTIDSEWENGPAEIVRPAGSGFLVTMTDTRVRFFADIREITFH